MPGCVHTQILAAPPHRRCLFWNGVPAHAVHGAPRVQAQTPSQPICTKVVWLQDSPAGVPATVPGSGQLQDAHEDPGPQQQ